jgi:site-specific DNA-cytosine methylase
MNIKNQECKRVLVGCEFSGAVRQEFENRGWAAFSCDLLPAEDGSPYHIEYDLMELLIALPDNCYDLLVLHPPCTALAVSGNRFYGEGQPYYEKRLESVSWTTRLWIEAQRVAKHVALENPVGVLNRLGGEAWPKPQYIQPWQFGHGETKKTGLWLHNLPPLEPTDIVEGREQRVWKMPPSADRWKERSRTFQGIASAMAQQWGSYIEGLDND